MTDFFLALMLPGAGDELQGIKKGLVELADMIAINKADGDNIKRANIAAADYRGALHILSPRSEHWQPPVVTYSALTGTGIAELWQKVQDHRNAHDGIGRIRSRRREQQVKWMWSMLEKPHDGAAAQRRRDSRQSEEDRNRGRGGPHRRRRWRPKPIAELLQMSEDIADPDHRFRPVSWRALQSDHDAGEAAGRAASSRVRRRRAREPHLSMSPIAPSTASCLSWSRAQGRERC